MGDSPTPTTIGELAILVSTRLDFIERQLDGLPARVQSLEYQVKDLKEDRVNRRQVLTLWLGIGATLAAGVAGVIIR